MAISLDENQERLVDAKRKDPQDRPKYYNAGLGEKVFISEDFEAYLILQGRQRNSKMIKWLREASGYQIQDSDRDALVNKALTAELDDAESSENEVAPIVDRFNRFRESITLDGFEGVAEVGALLADLQRPMGEIMAMASRNFHRKVCASFSKEILITSGVTASQTKQIQSWFTPLTAY